MLRSSLLIPVFIGCFLMTVMSSSPQESQKHEDVELKRHIKLIYSRMKAIEQSNKAVLTEVRGMHTLLVQTVNDKTADVKTTRNKQRAMAFSRKGKDNQSGSNNRRTINKTAGLKSSNNGMMKQHQSSHVTPSTDLKSTGNSEAKDVVTLFKEIGVKSPNEHVQESEDSTLVQPSIRKTSPSRDDCESQKNGHMSLVVSTLSKVAVVQFDGKTTFRKYIFPPHVTSIVYDEMCRLYFATVNGILKIKIPDYDKREVVIKHKAQHLAIDTSIQRLFILTFDCQLNHFDLPTMSLQNTKAKLYSTCLKRGIDLLVNPKSKQIFVNNYFRNELKLMDYKGNVLSTQKLTHRTSSMVFAGEYDQLIGYSRHTLVALSLNDTSKPTTLAKISAGHWPPSAYFNGTFAAFTKQHLQVYTYDGLKLVKATKIKFSDGIARTLAIIEE